MPPIFFVSPPEYGIFGAASDGSPKRLQDADAHQKRAEAPLTPRDGLAQRHPEKATISSPSRL